MYAKCVAAIAGRRVTASVILGGLLAAVLLLGGCAGIRQAAGTAAQFALLTATPTQPGVPGVPTIDTTGASADAASAQPAGDWTEAGQMTVTPAAPTAPQAQGTPEPEPTADGAAAAGVAQPIQFTGKIENLPNTGDWTGAWQVGGRLVRVAPGATIDQRYGRVALGEQVTVEGWPQTDGSLDAVWIIVHGTTSATATPLPQAGTQPNAGSQSAQPNTVATAAPAQAGEDQEEQDENDRSDRQNAQGQHNQGDDEQHEQAKGQNQQNDGAQNARPVEFRDVVQNMPTNGLVGTWQIGGRTVNVNARTRVQRGAEAALRQGAIVQVMGWQQPDGSLNAAYLMVKKNLNAKGDAGNAGDDQAGQGRGNGKGNGDGKSNGNGRGNGNGNGKGNGKGKGG